MSHVNPSAKEIHCKIVYYGPSLGGKTTNIQWIYQRHASDQRTKLVAVDSDIERTLFFDFLPLSVGEIRGYKTRFHLYTVPGQTFYELSREYILKGVDGLVFVADSEPERMEANIEAWHQLEKSLERQGYDVHRLPLVLQYNKRDLPGAVPVDEMEATFNPTQRPFFEAVANQGRGVMETLTRICQLVIEELKGGSIE
jgi:signal recognition particle receptor subunit beta